MIIMSELNKRLNKLLENYGLNDFCPYNDEEDFHGCKDCEHNVIIKDASKCTYMKKLVLSIENICNECFDSNQTLKNKLSDVTKNLEEHRTAYKTLFNEKEDMLKKIEQLELFESENEDLRTELTELKTFLELFMKTLPRFL